MSTFSTAFLSHDTYLVTIVSLYNVWLVNMDIIVIYHVADVYQIHVIVSMVSVQIPCSLSHVSDKHPSHNLLQLYP